MAKSTCLLALFVAVVVCTEAIRIDTPRPSPPTGKYFPSIKMNDSYCKDKPNGKYPVEGGSCKKYRKCVDGNGQVKECPAELEYDSKKGCVLPSEDHDCGKPKRRAPSDEEEKCPDSYGMFPVKSDCHKYMVCSDSVATVKDCPPDYVYSDANGGCVPGTECPKPSSEESVCKKANELLPNEKNYRSYIKCVNFVPVDKECPPQMAFDSTKRKCSTEELEKRKSNDILNVGQDE